MIIREDIVREARALIGVPFRHQGFDPATGIDCRGHLLCLAQSLGHTLLANYRNNYQRQPDSDEFRAPLTNELDPIELMDVRDGDVLFIRLPREEKPTHVGVIATGQYERMIIHAKATRLGGEICEEPLRRWEAYVEGAFRFRQLVEVEHG